MKTFILPNELPYPYVTFKDRAIIYVRKVHENGEKGCFYGSIPVRKNEYGLLYDLIRDYSVCNIIHF